MSFKATLNMFDNKYNVLECSYEIIQETDAEGQPASVVRGGKIHLTVESSGDTKIAESMVDNNKRSNGSVVFYKNNADATMKELKFEDAYVVGYRESFTSTGGKPMTEEFELSARLLTIGEMEFENTWVAY